jgi:hypothetical protein
MFEVVYKSRGFVPVSVPCLLALFPVLAAAAEMSQAYLTRLIICRIVAVRVSGMVIAKIAVLNANTITL